MKEKMVGIILGYIVLINLIGFVLMYIDKNRAIKNQWRIPEKVLFGTAIAFGSVGIHYGMKRFRHKTKHKSFVIGIPVIQLLQVLLLVAIVFIIK